VDGVFGLCAGQASQMIRMMMMMTAIAPPLM
jgi:hypothetical protein